MAAAVEPGTTVVVAGDGAAGLCAVPANRRAMNARRTVEVLLTPEP
ncbi:hypothetical protein ACFMQL_38985 [Nonomuraea fastidiosa]